MDMSELCGLIEGGDGLELFFLCQAEDGIRDLVRSRGLGDVYKRQGSSRGPHPGLRAYRELNHPLEHQGEAISRLDRELSLIHI